MEISAIKQEHIKTIIYVHVCEVIISASRKQSFGESLITLVGVTTIVYFYWILHYIDQLMLINHFFYIIPISFTSTIVESMDRPKVSYPAWMSPTVGARKELT